MNNKKIIKYLKDKRYKELEGYLENSINYEEIKEDIYLEVLALVKYKNKRLEESKIIFDKIDNEKVLSKKENLFNEESMYSNYKKLLEALKNADNTNSYKYIDNLINFGERNLIDLKRKLYIKDRRYIKALLCK